MDIAKLEKEKAEYEERRAGYSPDAIRLATSIRHSLVMLKQLTPDELIRSDLAGLSFEDERGEITQALRFASEIDLARLEDASPQMLGQLDQSAKTMLDAFNSILGLSAKGLDATGIQARSRLESQLRQIIEPFSNAAAPLIAYLTVRALSGGDVVGQRARQALKGLAEIEEDVRKRHASIKAMEASASIATRAIGTNATQSHFFDQATEHAQASVKWLSATIVSSLITAAIAAYIYWDAERRASGNASLSGAQFAQLSVARVLVFSLAVSVTIWCSRGYRAHRHNYVINRQRVNALATFEAFVTSSDDEQTKNTVIVQATASIFAPQHSGYDHGEGDTVVTPRIIEMLKPDGK